MIYCKAYRINHTQYTYYILIDKLDKLVIRQNSIVLLLKKNQHNILITSII